jgi:uncharacterized protein involved in exopolysaccharide biosynthesis
MWALTVINTIIRRSRYILINVLVVTLLAAAITFILPRYYRSTTTILPPISQGTMGGFGDLSFAQVAQAVASFSLPVMATQSDLYASMLRSETVLKAVVDSLDLQDFYGFGTPWAAVNQLRERISISVESDGIITVEAAARAPELAANIANLLVAELNRLNVQLMTEHSRQYVDFYEKRLAQTDQQLQQALDRLKSFQEDHMAISIELQSAALIENLAAQKANLTTAEIELELLKNTLGPGHPRLVAKRAEVSEIREKLREIETGTVGSPDTVLSAMDIPLKQIPDLSLRFSILTRDVKTQELIYETLARQLELARIEAEKTTSTVNVLDPARPATGPFKPRRLLIVVAALILSFFGSVFLVIAYDNYLRQPDTGDETMTQLRQILSGSRKKPLT